MIGDELERLLHFFEAASHGGNVIWGCLSQMLGRRFTTSTELNRKRPCFVSGFRVAIQSERNGIMNGPMAQLSEIAVLLKSYQGTGPDFRLANAAYKIECEAL